AHVHALAVARDLLANPPDTDDRERLPSQLLAAVALPPLCLLVSLHPDVVLREHEHRHEAKVRERTRVYSARCGERDVAAIQSNSLDERADPGARGLEPTQPRRDRRYVADMPGRKIEEAVSALQHLEEARFLLWHAHRGSTA